MQHRVAASGVVPARPVGRERHRFLPRDVKASPSAPVSDTVDTVAQRRGRRPQGALEARRDGHGRRSPRALGLPVFALLFLLLALLRGRPALALRGASALPIWSQ